MPCSEDEDCSEERQDRTEVDRETVNDNASSTQKTFEDIESNCIHFQGPSLCARWEQNKAINFVPSPKENLVYLICTNINSGRLVYVHIPISHLRLTTL